LSAKEISILLVIKTPRRSFNEEILEKISVIEGVFSVEDISH